MKSCRFEVPVDIACTCIFDESSRYFHSMFPVLAPMPARTPTNGRAEYRAQSFSRDLYTNTYQQKCDDLQQTMSKLRRDTIREGV